MSHSFVERYALRRMRPEQVALLLYDKGTETAVEGKTGLPLPLDSQEMAFTGSILTEAARDPTTDEPSDR